MDISNFIHQSIFEEKEKFTCLYDLFWMNFEEDGFVITDEDGHEIDSIFKAIAIKNLIGEFIYRLYDEFNETGIDDIIENLSTLGYSEDDIVDYCYENPDIDTDDEDDEISIKNALDYITAKTANKLLDLFAPDELFDYFFAATYDFEQDFTFAFEDVDEFQAFVDANTERLDDYKDEYPAVLNWIEKGMIV